MALALTILALLGLVSSIYIPSPQNKSGSLLANYAGHKPMRKTFNGPEDLLGQIKSDPGRNP